MAIDVYGYQYRRTDMQASSNSIAKETTKIEDIIKEFERLAAQAENLGERLTATLERTVGHRPQAGESASSPQPVPNGHLEVLSALTRRINNSNEHIRNELSELESLL